MIQTEEQKDVQIKLARVRSLLEEENAEAVFYRRIDHFAWLTSGGDHGIPYNSEKGECALLVTRQAFYLLTNPIEKRRILEEELHALEIEVVEYPWYESVETKAHQLVGQGKIISDSEGAGMTLEPFKLAQLRFSMTSLERTRYRYLGSRATELLENYCMSVHPGYTERELAAGLNKILQLEGLMPTVTLVACDERIDRYRHPIPQNKRFERSCMVVSCVRYKGLIVALTRMIHRGPLSVERKETFLKTITIDAELITATREGMDTASFFDHIKKVYAEAGYPEEWKLHHQGGAIGYQNRDYLLTPSTSYKMEKHQAFAWNPSITGAKSEDTIIIGEQQAEIITTSPSGWPNMKVTVSSGQTLSRPLILEI